MLMLVLLPLSWTAAPPAHAAEIPGAASYAAAGEAHWKRVTSSAEHPIDELRPSVESRGGARRLGPAAHRPEATPGTAAIEPSYDKSQARASAAGRCGDHEECRDSFALRRRRALQICRARLDRCMLTGAAVGGAVPPVRQGRRGGEFQINAENDTIVRT